MTAAVVALGAAVLLLAVLVAGLLRSHAEILKALHDLGAGLELERPGPVPVTVEGVRAPRRASGDKTPTTLRGETLDGDVVALSLLGQDTLIAFLSSGCTTCQEFWRAFKGPLRDLPSGARLVVVTKGPEEESGSALQERAPGAGVPLLLSDDAWDGFEVPGSPYFVYVDGTGTVVGEGSGSSWPQVADLMRQARADAAARTAGGGKVRESRDEQLLADAGIEPGHPSLYEETA
ncbi:MAG: hypothetical protein WCD35_14410 [Mycobacteriales bacterium]